MIASHFSVVHILLLGAFQIFHHTPLGKPVEARPSSARYSSESTGREVNLARYVFTEEELAERRAARQGNGSVQSAFHLRLPQDSSERPMLVRKHGRLVEERPTSNAYLYRDKNAWNRSDINGDGRGWGSRHPRSLSIPAGSVTSD